MSLYKTLRSLLSVSPSSVTAQIQTSSQVTVVTCVEDGLNFAHVSGLCRLLCCMPVDHGFVFFVDFICRLFFVPLPVLTTVSVTLVKLHSVSLLLIALIKQCHHLSQQFECFQ